MEAPMAGTRNSAGLCQIADRLGTLDVGKMAGMIAVERNPFVDIESLGRVRLVMKDKDVMRRALEAGSEAG